MNFTERLDKRQEETNSLLCVGLDSDINEIPKSIIKYSKSAYHSIYNFNHRIVDATFESAFAYKLNMAFYESQWIEGLFALANTISYIREKDPDMIVIIDAKRGDIGNTSEQYANELFDVIKADIATVNPYLGRDSLDPFLKRADKGVAVLCHTSNQGAAEFQSLKVLDGGCLRDLYEQVARNVALDWNKNKNCLLVVGATYPYELKKVRMTIGEEMPILVPGIGAQKGNLEETLEAGLNLDRRGLIINSSRGIIFASKEKNFAKEAGRKAEELRDRINSIRKVNK